MKDYPPYLDYPKSRNPMTNADRIRTILEKVGGEHRHFNLKNNVLTLL